MASTTKTNKWPTMTINPPEIGFDILCNFTDKTLEWEFANEQVSGLLVATNLAEGNSSRTIATGLLDTTSSWSTVACCSGGELLSGSLAPS